MSSAISEKPSNDKQINIISIFSLALGIFGWSSKTIGAIIITSTYSTSTLFAWIPVILSCISWLAAIILGLIGLKQIKASTSEKGRWLAVPSILISGIGLINLSCALLSTLLKLSLMGSTPIGY